MAQARRLLYVAPHPGKLEIDVFWIPEGNNDIRQVNNGTSCGLNNTLPAPWLSLPTINTHLCLTE